MIFSIKRQDFFLQIVKTARATSNNHPIKILSGLHIEADSRTNIVRLSATNHEISIKTIVPAAVEQDGCAVIESGLFMKVIEKLPEEDIHIEMQGDRLSISSGNTRFELPTMPAKDFPKVDIPMPGETVTVSKIKTLIQKTAFAAGKLDGRAVTQCVHLVLTQDGLTATASNGYCMAQTIGDKDCKGQTSILVPATSLKLFASIALDSDVYEMGVTGAGGKNVVFYDGTLLFSSRLVDGSFFDSNKLYSSFKYASSAILDSKDFASVFTAIRAMEPAGRIGIKFMQGGLDISYKGEDGSSSEMQLKAEVENPDNAIHYYSIQLLSECLRATPGRVTLSLSPEGTLMIHDASTRCLLIPMRASREMAKEKAAKKAA